MHRKFMEYTCCLIKAFVILFFIIWGMHMLNNVATLYTTFVVKVWTSCVMSHHCVQHSWWKYDTSKCWSCLHKSYYVLIFFNSLKLCKPWTQCPAHRSWWLPVELSLTEVVTVSTNSWEICRARLYKWEVKTCSDTNLVADLKVEVGGVMAH